MGEEGGWGRVKGEEICKYLSWKSTRDTEQGFWVDWLIQFNHRLKEIDFGFLLYVLSNNPPEQIAAKAEIGHFIKRRSSGQREVFSSPYPVATGLH